MAEKFAHVDEFTKELHAKEEEEKKKAASEMEGLLDELPM